MEPTLIERFKKKAEIHFPSHLTEYAHAAALSPAEAPVEPVDLATSAAQTTLVPWLTHRLSGRPVSMVEATRTGLSPAQIPMNALFDVATAPLSDPQYQSGKRNYFSAINHGLVAKARGIGDAGKDVHERYGALGYPIQAFHGITNPVSSTLYGIGEAGKYLLGKESAELVKRAERAIEKATARI